MHTRSAWAVIGATFALLVAVAAASGSPSGVRSPSGPPHLVAQAIVSLRKAEVAERTAESLIQKLEFTKAEAALKQSQGDVKSAVDALKRTSANIGSALTDADYAASEDASALGDVVKADERGSVEESMWKHEALKKVEQALALKTDAIAALQPTTPAPSAPVCNIGSGPPKNDGAIGNAAGPTGGVQGGILLHCAGLADTVTVDVPGHTLSTGAPMSLNSELKSCSAQGDTVTCKLNVPAEKSAIAGQYPGHPCTVSCYTVVPYWKFAASDSAQQSGSCGLTYYVKATYARKNVLPRTATQVPPAGQYCH